MLLFGLTPFEAWILLIACSLIPTVFIYLFLSRVEKSLATLEGNIGGLAMKLGGPVAFYAVLLWLGKTYIPADEVPLFVSLLPSQEARAASLNLVEGSYKYIEPMSGGGVRTSEGRVEVTLGQGGWQAKLPQVVLSKAVELAFKDQNGNVWGVRAFYPNYNRQELFQPSSRPTSGLLFQRPAAGGALAVTAAPAFAAERSPAPLALIAQKEGQLKFDNYARPVGGSSGRTYYQWRVFLDGPPSVLETIAQVQYLLHPTFPEPFQVRTNPGTRFALDTSGWGSFYIFITVRYKNGNEEKISYYLDLSKKWPE